MINKFAEACANYSNDIELAADLIDEAQEDFDTAFEELQAFLESMVNIRKFLELNGLSSTVEYKALASFVHDLTADVSAIEGALASEA